MDSSIDKNASFAAMDAAGYVTIGVASPDIIRSWSHGEVKTPETINYRTFKPEKGGLFCEKIFGPSHNYECACGKYKRQPRDKGVICDRCGVEVTEARVRRERMGRIELAVPVSHIWFYKTNPSRLALMLEIKQKVLDQVLYYEGWIVTNKGDTPLQDKQLLTEEQYREACTQYGKNFSAAMGAGAIEELLGKLDLAKLCETLRANQKIGKSTQERASAVKRLRLIEGFYKNGMDPRWMILHVLPVIPPELRPLVPLDGSRFASSDLTDLYRRVINRNIRLRSLKQIPTPEVIIRNEQRMLQEAVDALLDNGRHGRAVTSNGNRQLKSLAHMLHGKQGRFRQNLLGKRVDYSGRSVIVVGPELNINQCGLPKEMALVLFEPFIMRELKERGHVHTVRNAKRWIEARRDEVFDILDNVIKGHPILLNRAPTLHRLSIQAFDPVLIEGQAIRLHPLVCSAFNADFDGDQMAVHIPLSNAAQLEAKLIMLAPNNIFSPANGKPVTIPSQDITLGVYFLCYEDKTRKAHFKATKPRDQRWFNDYFEVLRAIEASDLHIHDFFNMRNPYYDKVAVWGHDSKNSKFIVTTAGRCIFHEIWPDAMGFYNAPVGKKEIGAMIKDCYETIGRDTLIHVLDALKNLGYEYATKAGFSIGIQDMIIPECKKELIAAAQKSLEEIRNQRRIGAITEKERYNKTVDTWNAVGNQLGGYLSQTLEKNEGRSEINPVWAMLDSGARGSKEQIRQLSGMRGLMSKPSGDIIETPILSNFREGLTVLEYFISTHGARKGLADTALKTADSGYMTRRLVDVAHDVVCVEQDCGTTNGIRMEPLRDDNKDAISLADRIVGRFSVMDIYDYNSGTILVKSGDEISAPFARKIVDAGYEYVHVRSVLTCVSKNGVCAKCYGRNLATGDMPNEGDALGIIAAQSIGEPGTQLTMRTFHSGGTAVAGSNVDNYKASQAGIVRYIDTQLVRNLDGRNIVTSKSGSSKISIENEEGIELEVFDLQLGSTLYKEEGDKVAPGEALASWDPYNVPIISKYEGVIAYADLIEGTTLRRQLNSMGGHEELTVQEHSDDVHPAVQVKAADDGSVLETYQLPADAHLLVLDHEKVAIGQMLAKTPRRESQTGDITGGLPRVAELFEARRPKETAEIAQIDGMAVIDKPTKSARRIIKIRDEDGHEIEHIIPAGKRLVVAHGDTVKRGQELTDGTPAPEDLLRVVGPSVLQNHIVNEVQRVYRRQGVEINDKHIEIIVRQMMRRVRIQDPGSTRFLSGEIYDRQEFYDENKRVLDEGGEPAKAEPKLLGISKASLSTDSFISAASFQHTTQILTEAATLGKIDYLRGFKENVIIGHLIPAGTGYYKMQNVKLELVDDNPPETGAAIPGETSKDDLQSMMNDFK